MPSKSQALSIDEMEIFSQKIQRIVGISLALIDSLFIGNNIYNFTSGLYPELPLGTFIFHLSISVLLIIPLIFSAIFKKSKILRYVALGATAACVLVSMAIFNRPIDSVLILLNMIFDQWALVLCVLIFHQYTQLNYRKSTIVVSICAIVNGLVLFFFGLAEVIYSIVFTIVFIATLPFINYIFHQKLQYYYQAKSLAERERESLAVFAHMGLAVNTVTHDLKGRIALQRGLVEKIRLELKASTDGIMDVERQGRLESYTEILLNSCKALSGFTETLRQELSDSNQIIKRFDLAKLCENIATSYRVGLDAPVHFTPARPDFFVDNSPYPWIQILENIIRNALESTSPAPCVQISLNRDNDGIELSIANNGPPIPGCVNCSFGFRCREQPCQNFVLGKTSKSGGSGTGMVSVINTLVGLGADLNIRSQPGETCFFIRIPGSTKLA